MIKTFNWTVCKKLHGAYLFSRDVLIVTISKCAATTSSISWKFTANLTQQANIPWNSARSSEWWKVLFFTAVGIFNKKSSQKMPKQKVKINIKERLDENVLDLSLSGKRDELWYFFMENEKCKHSNLILEIEQIPVKDIAALRRATVIDLSSNNIRFLPVSFSLNCDLLTEISLKQF